jgi:hypothetical protein
MLCSFFPDTAVYLNYKMLGTTFASAQIPEVDCFLPFLSLAFEYNGSLHYQVTNIYGDYKKVHSKDQQKRELLQQNGTIPIPWRLTEQRSHFDRSAILVG